VGRDVSSDKGGDQAAWRDLMARLELPSPIDPADVPWPDRENLHGTSGPDGGRPGQSEAEPLAGKGRSRDRDHVIRPATAPDDYQDTPTSPDLGFLDFLDADDEDTSDPDNRYIPPPVPPQPRLDPVAKGAWAALFGGPGYLLLATIFAWQVPGWATARPAGTAPIRAPLSERATAGG
jgi:hypothetical protein